MTGGQQYLAELREQPEVLARLLRKGRPEVEAIAERLRGHPPTHVVIAARGSSDNAARYAQYLFGAGNQLTVALAAPSLFTLYGAAPRMDSALVLGISQSGQTPDVVAVIAAARAQGCTTLAITNDVSSPLAQAAGHCLPLRAGEEAAVAATKTFTAELLVLAMLSAALADDAARWQELAAVPELAQRTIDSNTELDAVTALGHPSRLVVLARGFNYASAFEIALKIKETSYVLAEPYSFADLLHGPVAMLEEGFPVLVVAPRGRSSGDVPRVVETVARRGARLLAISDDDALLAQAELGLRLPAGVPEWLSPFPAVIAGQLLAGALAAALGHDPDHPRGLTKVTLTR